MIEQAERRHGHLVIETVGEAAPWLVLVHGVSQDHRLFDKQVEAFAGSHRLLLVDLPGHGLSTGIPGPYGVAEFGAHIEKAMEACRAGPAFLWGTHLGASAALFLATRRRDLFSRLILESPVFPGRPLPSVAGLLKRVSSAAREAGIERAREIWWSEGPWFARMRSDPLRCRAEEQRAMIDAFAGGPWLEAGLISKPLDAVEDGLRGLDLPVVIMNGEHDVQDFLEAAEALSALLPRCRRVQVPDGGGFPLWEDPQTVNRLAAEAMRDAG